MINRTNILRFRPFIESDILFSLILINNRYELIIQDSIGNFLNSLNETRIGKTSDFAQF